MSDPAYEAVSKARRQEQGGNPEGAARTLEDYLATDPHNIPPRMELARIYIYSLDNRRFGSIQLNAILDMDPDNVEALKASTTLKSSDKHLREEVDGDFRHLLALVVEHNDPKEFAAVCAAYARFLRRQMVDFPRSGEYYAKAVAADPDEYAYHQDYAVLLLNDLKDYRKAKEELEAVMRLHPGDPSVKSNYDRLMRTRFNRDGTLKKSLKDRILRRRGGSRGSVSSRTRRGRSPAFRAP